MRNQFNLSHEHKTSLDMGQLIPVQCDEVLAGDTFSQRSTALARVAPLVHPLMHRVELRMHSFYVPNRVIWDGLNGGFTGNWEKFITGEDSTTPKPTITTTGADEELLDYMGVPTVTDLTLDAMPLMGFNMIYNQFYRDQDLQVERDLLDATVPQCAWQKDYFTIARPTPQQGDPVGIPVDIGDLPVGLRDLTDINTNVPGMVKYSATGKAVADKDTIGGTDAARRLFAQTGEESNLQISIDDLRRSLALQRFAEARMRFGSRYVDYLRYIGVNPSDGRLDRPEYLGGGKEILSFSEVLSTAESTDVNVGDMKGHGIGMGRTNGFSKMFEEHGWVYTLMSARPKTVYANALPKKFTRETVMDYWQKELETLPWQEVSQREVDASGDADTVFGYVPRFEEYRHGTSHVSSTLREGTEKDWTMAREFSTPPTLNGSFIECTPKDDIYQDSNMPDLVVNVQHNIQARRFVGQTASMGIDL